jgi:hypothetical protein
LNSRVNCLLSMTHLLLHKTPNSVSSEPGAAQVYEYTRLSVLEEKVIRALGPPSKRMRYDKKLGKLVDDEGAPDDI